MEIFRRAITETPLQIDLTGSGVEQIGAPHHMGDALGFVVYDHGELIGPKAVGAPQNKITTLCFEIFYVGPLEAVREGDRFLVDAQAISAGGLTVQAGATDSWVGSVADFFPSAGAGEGEALIEKRVQGRTIGLVARALVKHRAVPRETKGFEGEQDLPVGARDASGRVDILDPEQPFSVVGEGVEIARYGRDERAEVERTRRGRGKSANVGAGKGMVGAHRLELWTSCL